jgi:hypothetical protein
MGNRQKTLSNFAFSKEKLNMNKNIIDEWWK